MTTKCSSNNQKRILLNINHSVVALLGWLYTTALLILIVNAPRLSSPHHINEVQIKSGILYISHPHPRKVCMLVLSPDVVPPYLPYYFRYSHSLVNSHSHKESIIHLLDPHLVFFYFYIRSPQNFDPSSQATRLFIQDSQILDTTSNS